MNTGEKLSRVNTQLFNNFLKLWLNRVTLTDDSQSSVFEDIHVIIYVSGRQPKRL